MTLPTVACVLRSGPSFGPLYVQRLAAAVARHSTTPHRFVCLSDVEIPGVETIPLQYDWPKWWPKMELWGGALGDGLCVYLDLDSVIVGSLDPLLRYEGDLAMMRDLNLAEHKQVPGLPAIGSAVVVWRGDAMRPVYDAFVSDPDTAIRTNRRMDHFIRRHLPPCDYVQDVWPGLVASARRGFSRRVADVQPKGASILAIWGSPRLHELPEGSWLRELWERAA